MANVASIFAPWLRRLIPRVETHLLMALDARSLGNSAAGAPTGGSPLAPASGDPTPQSAMHESSFRTLSRYSGGGQGAGFFQPSGVELAWITNESDPDFESLVQEASQQGLDRPWCQQQLSEGAAAVVAIAADEDRRTPAGMGFLTTHPFHVEEISRTFDCGPSGGYLYATYVDPRFRGRRIQRAIDLARAQRCAQLHRPWAFALVEGHNHASLRGHRAGGFTAVARIDHVDWASRSFICTRRLSAARPGYDFRDVIAAPNEPRPSGSGENRLLTRAAR